MQNNEMLQLTIISWDANILHLNLLNIFKQVVKLKNVISILVYSGIL